ncbi:dockerin type I domain-containing protein [Candidatus Poribacteria bacterium]
MPRKKRKPNAVLPLLKGMVLLCLFLTVSSCSDQDSAVMPEREYTTDESRSNQETRSFSILDAIKQGFAEAGRTAVYYQIAPELEKSLRNTGQTSSLAAPSSHTAGDVNEDGVVDISDIVLLARHFGTHEGDSLYDAKYDLNSDGKIDLLDLIIAARNCGAIVDVTPPIVELSMASPHPEVQIESTGQNSIRVIVPEGFQVPIGYDLPQGYGLKVVNGLPVLYTVSDNVTSADDIAVLVDRIAGEGGLLTVGSGQFTLQPTTVNPLDLTGTTTHAGKVMDAAGNITNFGIEVVYTDRVDVEGSISETDSGLHLPQYMGKVWEMGNEGHFAVVDANGNFRLQNLPPTHPSNTDPRLLQARYYLPDGETPRSFRITKEFGGYADTYGIDRKVVTYDNISLPPEQFAELVRQANTGSVLMGRDADGRRIFEQRLRGNRPNMEFVIYQHGPEGSYTDDQVIKLESMAKDFVREHLPRDVPVRVDHGDYPTTYAEKTGQIMIKYTPRAAFISSKDIGFTGEIDWYEIGIADVKGWFEGAFLEEAASSQGGPNPVVDPLLLHTSIFQEWSDDKIYDNDTKIIYIFQWFPGREGCEPGMRYEDMFGL